MPGMPPNPRPIMTKRGYQLDEVVSALQKEIRRGQEETALFWAQEMMESGYFNYVWKRLAIIACEDVGMADPLAAVLVGSLWATFLQIKKVQSSPAVEGDILAFAVLYLTRAPKNREVDDFKLHVEGRKNSDWHPEVPDYALDMHTNRGRALGRDYGNWLVDGVQLENKAGPNRYEASDWRLRAI
jgi:replication-associated recombination protein RarA